MPLRNFGLSFSRRSARPNADISWRPRHAVGIGLVLVLVLLAALWAMLAHAQSEDQMTAQRMITAAWPALAGACIAPIVQRLPDGQLHAWCRNGERFHIELTSPPDSIWKSGPSVLCCDTVFRGTIQCRW
jgi:hypothetical protein